MIPNRLEDWTLERVRELAGRGVSEGDTYDFKSILPHRNDNSGKHRLRKTCAAFANSSGGFLIFGVDADMNKPANERIVGLEASLDFPLQFGSFPALCEPAVEWEPKLPAIPIGDAARVIPIVFIPQSWKAPHAIQDRDGWVFPKRTSKGNESMTYAEVQQMFLGYYEKRLKLQLLKAELTQLAEVSDLVALAKSEESSLTGSVLPVLELRVIETILSDTYSITHSQKLLLQLLNQLRPKVRMLNAYTDTLRASVAVHPDMGDHRIRRYLPSVDSLRSEIKRLAREAIEELDKVVPKPI